MRKILSTKKIVYCDMSVEDAIECIKDNIYIKDRGKEYNIDKTFFCCEMTDSTATLIKVGTRTLVSTFVEILPNECGGTILNIEAYTINFAVVIIFVSMFCLWLISNRMEVNIVGTIIVLIVLFSFKDDQMQTINSFLDIFADNILD